MKINTTLYCFFVADEICIPLLPIIYVCFQQKDFAFSNMTAQFIFRVAQIDLELHNLCRTAR